MQLRFSDGEMKMDKTIGLLLTHGAQHGALKVSLKLRWEIVESMTMSMLEHLMFHLLNSSDNDCWSCS